MASYPSFTIDSEQGTTSQGQRQREVTRDSQYPDLLLEIGISGARTWYFIYRDALGVLHHQKIGDADDITREEARLRVNQLTLDIALSDDLFPETLVESQHPLRFNVWVEHHYLPFAKSYKRSWGADDSYLKNHHVPFFGEGFIHEVTRDQVTQFRDRMMAKGYAPGTVNRCLVLLRYMFNLAIKWGVGGIDKNPTKDVPLVPDTKKMERFLSEEEAQRLYKAVEASENPFLQDIIPLLLLTGGRKREILDARWENVLWPRKLLLIPLPKGGKPRYIPLSSQALKILESVRARQMDLFQIELPVTGWVFPNPKTQKPYVSIYNSWDSARKRAGLETLRMHDLRHSFASFLVNHGRSLYEVQRILGHTQIRTTQRYAHLSQDTLLEAVNMAGNMLEKELFAPADGRQGINETTGKNQNHAKERKRQTKRHNGACNDDDHDRPAGVRT